LIGELAERFDLSHLASRLTNLSLDDFPTLQSILDFVIAASGDDSAEPPREDLGAAAPTPAERPRESDSEKHATEPSVLEPHGAEPDSTSSAAPQRLVDAAPRFEPRLDEAAVKAAMLDFIIEQTGYPPEMIEFDADLEADLGIDSIKKAQLIGELAERFDLSHLADRIASLSLDDFPTLESILQFVVRTPASDASEQVEGDAPAAGAESSTAPPVSSLERRAPTPQKGAPEQPVPLTSEDTGTPATVAGQTAVLPPSRGGSISPTLDESQVRASMLDFIIEQTGYPPEMIEFDADLEADLGIDSIKKAQLIGELAERFDLSHLADRITSLSLDDFPTLESILRFVTQPPVAAEALGAASETASASEPAPDGEGADQRPGVAERPTITVVAEQAPEVEAGQPPAEQAAVMECGELRVLQLHGTSYEMGLQHGRSQATEIKTIMERHAELYRRRPEKFPELKAALADPRQYFGEEELEELRGIAAGMGVPVEEVMAHNLGIYPGYVPGCAQFAVTAGRNPTYGLIHAANEDSPLALWLRDCLVRTVQVRRPRNGITHVTFSIAGQVGGLNGINEVGLAVTSTLLLDRPRRCEMRHGTVHSVIVKRILEQAADIQTAIEILRTLPRLGAWSLCLSSAQSDQLWYVEYDGESLKVQNEWDRVATTNHCLLHPSLAAVPLHSKYRLARLQTLLRRCPNGGVSSDWSQHVLRDRFDLERKRETTHPTMNTICRVDNQVSIVMQPQEGNVWATPGPMANGSADTFYRLRIDELFGKGRFRRDVMIRSDGDRPIATLTGPGAGKKQPEKRKQSTATHTESASSLPAEPDRVMHRYVLRPVEMPLPESAPSAPQWAGAALILGQNATTQALRQHLEQAGVVVHELPDPGDAPRAVAELERLWQTQPVMHLFLMTGLGQPATSASLRSGETDLVGELLVPYFVCQRWAQLVAEAGLLERATLAAVTQLGGDFGLLGQSGAVVGGGLAGLLKGVHRECPAMTVKVIDVAPTEPADQVAVAVCRELGAGTPDVEVAVLRGQRRVLRAVPQPVSAVAPAEIRPGGTWVVTGGARGITAVVALELACRFGLKMHLIGSTPAPQIDPAWRDYSKEQLDQLRQSVVAQALREGQLPAPAWEAVRRAIEIDKTLQRFDQAGVPATYHACDVRDREALARVLEEIRRTDGPIEGVIHGAGLESACRFDRKRPEKVEATIAVKVGGAAALIQLTANDPLRYFIGFGSTSGRFGGVGQTDYSAASEMLCKMCDRLRNERPGCRAVGIHWPPWADVGMAARPESRLALQASNLTFMEPLEGVAHLIDELVAGLPEGEVLFLDRAGAFDTSQSVLEAADASRIQRQRLVREAPLAELFYQTADRSALIVETRLDPQMDPFLTDHRDRGVPILPAAVGVEILGEAAAVLEAGEGAAGRRVVAAVHNVQIHSGLRFHAARPETVRALAARSGERIDCELRTDFLDRQGRLLRPDQTLMAGQIELASERDEIELPATLAFECREHDWQDIEYVDHWNQMRPARHGRIFHGPALSDLRRLAVHGCSACAEMVIAPAAKLAGSRNAAGWLLPSAALDACLWACDLFLCWTQQTVQLPQAMKRLVFGRPPRDGESCTVRLQLTKQDDDSATFDFALLGQDGTPLIAATGCRFAKAVDKARRRVLAAKRSPRERAGIGELSRGDKATGRTRRDNGRTQSARSADSVSAQALLVASPRSWPSDDRDDTSGRGDVALRRFPIIDSVVERAGSNRVVTEATFDPRTDPFLIHHRFQDRPLLPAVIGMEAMFETVKLLAPDRHIAVLRDLKLQKRFAFADDEPRRARIRADRQGDTVACEFVTIEDPRNVCFSAVIQLADRAEPIQVEPLREPLLPYHAMDYSTQRILRHGPPLQSLTELALARFIGWAHITAPSPDEMLGQRTGRQWLLPVALLDACFVALYLRRRAGGDAAQSGRVPFGLFPAARGAMHVATVLP